MENKKTLNQLRKEIRQINAPTVWRYKVSEEKTILVVCYEDREETYELVRSDSYKSIREKNGIDYDRYDAERLCKENSHRQIHYQTKED